MAGARDDFDYTTTARILWDIRRSLANIMSTLWLKREQLSGLDHSSHMRGRGQIYFTFPSLRRWNFDMETNFLYINNIEFYLNLKLKILDFNLICI